MSKHDEDKKKFIAEAKNLSGAAYNMLNLWDGELQDALHGSPKILEAYSRAFNLSFDEWWHAFSDFVDTVETEFTKSKVYKIDLSVTLQPGNDMTPGQIDDALRSMLDYATEISPGDEQGKIHQMQFAIGEVKEYHG